MYTYPLQTISVTLDLGWSGREGVELSFFVHPTTGAAQRAGRADLPGWLLTPKCWVPRQRHGNLFCGQLDGPYRHICCRVIVPFPANGLYFALGNGGYRCAA